MLKTCIIAPVTWYMYVEVVQISASGTEDCGFESTPGYEVVGVWNIAISIIFMT
jgi:hypothetical protein